MIFHGPSLDKTSLVEAKKMPRLLQMLLITVVGSGTVFASNSLATPKSVYSTVQKAHSLPSEGGEGSGTGDGTGGGNDLCKEPISSHIVSDITKLAAYQKFLRPISENLSKEISNAESTKKQKSSETEARPELFVQLASTRSWYIAPCLKLAPLSPDNLGVPTDQSSIGEQPAAQDEKTVWIRKETFQKNSMKQQAERILQELIEILYAYKFQSMQRYCAFSSIRDRKQCLVSFQSEQDQASLHVLRSEQLAGGKRKLNARDYQNIRAVVAALLAKGTQMSLREFRELLGQYDFDSRVFGRGDEIDSAEDLTVSQSSYFGALQTLGERGVAKMPCIYAGQSETYHCSMKVERGISVATGASQVELVRYTLSVLESKEQWVIHQPLYHNNISLSLAFRRVGSFDGELYSEGHLATAFTVRPKLGDEFGQLQLFVNAGEVYDRKSNVIDFAGGIFSNLFVSEINSWDGRGIAAPAGSPRDRFVIFAVNEKELKRVARRAFRLPLRQHWWTLFEPTKNFQK